MMEDLDSQPEWRGWASCWDSPLKPRSFNSKERLYPAAVHVSAKRGWFQGIQNTVFHNQQIPSELQLQTMMHSGFFPVSNCLLWKQTVRSSKIRFYFWMWTYWGLRVLYTWNRCEGSNARAGRANMFAVTSLCQMLNSAETKMCYVTSVGWLQLWRCAEKRRGLGFGLDERHVRLSKAAVKSRGSIAAGSFGAKTSWEFQESTSDKAEDPPTAGWVCLLACDGRRWSPTVTFVHDIISVVCGIKAAAWLLLVA